MLCVTLLFIVREVQNIQYNTPNYNRREYSKST